MPGDLHCHTKLSNSSMGIDDLIVLAQKRGVGTIAITDLDCQAGTVRAKIIGERRGITVIPGVELSSFDTERNCTVHILCYQSDSPDRLEGLCHRNVVARKKASQFMTLKIAQRYPISAELVMKCASGSTAVFKQHIMHSLMECGLTNRIYGELYHELFSKESDKNVLINAKYPSPQEVIAAVHEAGGVAVLAHPGRYDDLSIAEQMISIGIDGFEVWHPDNTQEQTDALAALAKKNGLLTTGGSDFKGMYTDGTISVGDYLTPDNCIKAINSYKSKMKKRALQAQQK